MKSQRPTIWHFEDYRLFLEAMFAFKKRENAKFSYQYCARRLKTTASYLKHVHVRKRNISLEKVSQIAELYSFTAFERHYFIVLFLFSTTRDQDTRAYFFSVMEGLKGQGKYLGEYAERPLSTNDQAEALRDGVATLLMQIAKFPDARFDPQWLRARMIEPTSIEEIEQALETLVTKKIVRREGEHLRLIEEVHSSPDPYDLHSFKIYRTGLLRVHRMLEEVRTYKPCSFLMGDFAVDAQIEAKIAAEFNAFTTRVVQAAEKVSVPDRVITLSNNLYTAARSTV